MMTPETLRQAGLDALRRDLGAAGMARFIQLFETGKGDYTAERWQWLPQDADVKTIAEAIETAKAQG
jgi:hypothetical protein